MLRKSYILEERGVLGPGALEPGRPERRALIFYSFGPGLPDVRPGDNYEVKGGLIRLKVNQAIPGLLFAVYPYTEHRLEIGGRTFDLSKEVAAGGRVTISLKPPLLQAWRTGETP